MNEREYLQYHARQHATDVIGMCKARNNVGVPEK